VCFTLVALVLGWQALMGHGTLGPEVMLDADPLYAGPNAGKAPIAPPADPTPITLDLPRDLAVARGFWAGRLDHWNPRAGAGAPLWAELGGPFFPLKLPFYLIPTRWMYHVFLLLRLVFAALGTYALARGHGLGFTSAIAAGIVFELCDFVLYQVPFGVYSNTFVLPWVALAAEALSRRANPRSVVAAALALGIALAAGHAGIATICLGAFVASILGDAAAIRYRGRPIGATLLCAGAAIALGLALAAPTLLPTAHLIGIGTSYKNAAVGENVRASILGESRMLMPQLWLPQLGGGGLFGPFTLGLAAIGVFAGGRAPRCGASLRSGCSSARHRRCSTRSRTCRSFGCCFPCTPTRWSRCRPRSPSVTV
jgi:hypothetical protein